MGEPFLHEFLYRGRPSEGPGSGDPAWHCIIGQYITVPGQSEPQLVDSGALTPGQAKDAGFPLTVIVKTINTAAIEARDAQAAELLDLKKQIEALTQERDELLAESRKRPAS